MKKLTIKLLSLLLILCFALSSVACDLKVILDDMLGYSSSSDSEDDYYYPVEDTTPSWSFETIYNQCSCASPWAKYGTDYLYIDTNPSDYDYDSKPYQATKYADTALSAIRSINTKLSLPSYLYDEMMEARAIDGRLSFSGTEVDVSWRYHPDTGLEVRYTKK